MKASTASPAGTPPSIANFQLAGIVMLLLVVAEADAEIRWRHLHNRLDHQHRRIPRGQTVSLPLDLTS